MAIPTPKLPRRLVQLLLAGCVALLAAGASAGWWAYTERPQFCLSCHNMKPFYASWAGSSHYPEALCVDCHTRPGLGNKLAYKLRYSGELVGMLGHDYRRTALRGGIRDESCTRSGCHDAAALMNHRVPLAVAAATGRLQHVRLGGLFFSHETHLGKDKRGIEVRCVSCHNQLVQGRHAAVDWQACVLCHFKGGNGTPVTGCGVCHTAPQGTVSFQGRTFAHAAYTQRGMTCETCHAGMTQGSGQVETNRCRQCHAADFSLDRIRDPELMHRRHVSERSVDCRSCHEPITHRIQQLSPVLARGQRYGPQLSVYMGSSGKGLANDPDVMFRSRVTCEACHNRAGTGGVGPASLKTCVACHGTGYDRLARQWQGAVRHASEALAPFLQQVEAAVKQAPAGARRRSAEALYRSARDNHRLLLDDGSGGVHNIAYSYALLDKSDEMLRLAVRTLQPGAASARRVPGSNAASFCHRCHFGTPVAAPARRSAFADFRHEAHLARGLDCARCHAAMPGPHGTVRLTRAACNDCHHGRARRQPESCRQCHAAQARMLVGSGVPEVAVTRHAMGALRCVDCHGAVISGDREVVRAACVRCHAPAYGALLDTWQANTAATLTQVRTLAGSRRDPQAAEARRYLALVQADRSRGAHNFLYARRVLDRARRLLQGQEVASR